MTALFLLIQFVSGNESSDTTKGQSEVLRHFVNCIYMYVYFGFWVYKMCSVYFCREIVFMLNNMVKIKQGDSTGKFVS